MVDQAGPERRAGARRHRAVVVCPPGAEDACRDELVALGVRPKPAGPGTFELDATTRQVYAANLWLRTASRVLVRAATFRATDFTHLLAGAEEILWDTWLDDGVAPAFRVSTRDSKLYHTEAIAERLHQVAGPPPLEGQPQQLFVVRIERNTVSISADASGDALHHRAWRTGIGPAPLRTSLAAARRRVGLADRRLAPADRYGHGGLTVTLYHRPAAPDQEAGGPPASETDGEPETGGEPEAGGGPETGLSGGSA